MLRQAEVSALRVLLVESNRAQLSLLSAPLRAAGLDVTPVHDFEAAVALLKADVFDGLVTAHHLESHNGLHLVLRGLSGRPGMIAVVTTPAPDAVLEGEAAAFGAVCAVAPWNNPAALISVLRSAGIQRA